MLPACLAVKSKRTIGAEKIREIEKELLLPHEPFALNPTIGKTRGVKRTEAIYSTRKFYAHECLCSFVKSFGGWRASDKSRAGCKSLNFFFVSDDDFWRCKWKCMLISSTDVLCERPSIKSDARNDTVDVTDK